MNDFQKSIHRRESSSYEQIRVSEIEKDKKGKEDPYKGLPTSPSKPLAFAIMVSAFKKFFSFFNFKGKGKWLFFDQGQMVEDIVAFRKLLYILSQEDQSHNPEYTQHLSELWHNLLDDCNSLLASTPQASDHLSKLKNFINEMHHYPPGEDHTLGYYFTEYAGKDWIPFPFMEMLQVLHEEAQAKQQTATLTYWITELTDVLSSSGYTEPPLEPPDSGSNPDL
jgi:hypothetical protein